MSLSQVLEAKRALVKAAETARWEAQRRDARKVADNIQALLDAIGPDVQTRTEPAAVCIGDRVRVGVGPENFNVYVSRGGWRSSGEFPCEKIAETVEAIADAIIIIEAEKF